MPVRITIKDEEVDVLLDLADGDSCNSPEDFRYEILMGFIDRVFRSDKREYDMDASLARNTENYQ